MDYETYCAMGEAPPVICYDCGAAFDPRDRADIEAHRDDHWHEYLRAQCPIPLPPSPTNRPVAISEQEEEVPF